MYQCLVCSQKCTNMSRLMRHVKRHTKTELLQMSIFNKGLFIKTKESNGPRNVQADAKPVQVTTRTNKPIESDFICKLCNKSFETKSDFESHCSNHYFAIFTCHFCNAQFHDKDKMNVHAEVHLLQSVGDCIFSLEQDFETTPQYISMLADFYQAGYRYGQTNTCTYDPLNFQLCYLELAKNKL